jgi:hypothetical protein
MRSFLLPLCLSPWHSPAPNLHAGYSTDSPDRRMQIASQACPIRSFTQFTESSPHKKSTSSEVLFKAVPHSRRTLRMLLVANLARISFQDQE